MIAKPISIRERTNHIPEAGLPRGSLKLGLTAGGDGGGTTCVPNSRKQRGKSVDTMKPSFWNYARPCSKAGLSWRVLHALPGDWQNCAYMTVHESSTHE
jgi:hypothetical protein